MPDLLLEILTEELPAIYIQPALEQLAKGLLEGLSAARLECGTIRTGATPRRLAAGIPGIPESQPPAVQEIMGPPERFAFDAQGRPTKAAQGFARAQGVAQQDITVKETPNGPYCYAKKEIPGASTISILPGIVSDAVSKITSPKSMRWKGPGFYFARPIRGLLALFGSELLPLELNGVQAKASTAGHRFLSPDEIILTRADFEEYSRQLRARHAIIDPRERRQILRALINKLLEPHGSTLEDEQLLDEVTGMLEWPNAVKGSFDPRYLGLPSVVVETAMKHHQKCFPVRDAAGRLLPLFVAAVDRDERHLPVIRRGNEAVLQARLADAQFFWDEDRKRPLAERVNELGSVLFHEQLGSYLDRTARVEMLTAFTADRLAVSEQDKLSAVRAAHLAKADLVTAMVTEFPELQGIMGKEYALASGEPPDVAEAISEHYLPRTASDPLPGTMAGTVLSLADKLDSIVGGFAAGLAPSGSQDPYALRRFSNAIIRIITTRKLGLSLGGLFEKARACLPHPLLAKEDLLPTLTEFFRDRLYQLYLEKGYQHDHLKAVLATGFDDLADMELRLNAIVELSSWSQWSDLVTIVQRTFKIYRNTGAEGEVEEELFEDKLEEELWQTYKETASEVRSLVGDRNYRRASELYHDRFAKTVHAFFDRVYVNVEDGKIRNNRLLMMKAINRLYADGIADLAHIVTAPQ